MIDEQLRQEIQEMINKTIREVLDNMRPKMLGEYPTNITINNCMKVVSTKPQINSVDL